MCLCLLKIDYFMYFYYFRCFKKTSILSSSQDRIRGNRSMRKTQRSLLQQHSQSAPWDPKAFLDQKENTVPFLSSGPSPESPSPGSPPSGAQRKRLQNNCI
ncbi:hypothetical protein ATANTOWER_024286 [Ataeniobius toweri]|uniref:Uncharacterized protein n=1 Tax=Ataeniobius toweri TaxID=208326 RepID=A0ABU7C3B3_9TELE|nr:hypothetical protein [Ataeniobius toweri]